MVAGAERLPASSTASPRLCSRAERQVMGELVRVSVAGRSLNCPFSSSQPVMLLRVALTCESPRLTIASVTAVDHHRHANFAGTVQRLRKSVPASYQWRSPHDERVAQVSISWSSAECRFQAAPWMSAVLALRVPIRLSHSCDLLIPELVVHRCTRASYSRRSRQGRRNRTASGRCHPWLCGVQCGCAPALRLLRDRLKVTT